jgi:hypothetical protein
MFSQKSNLEPERFWNVFPPKIKYITHPQKDPLVLSWFFPENFRFFEAFKKTNKTGGHLIPHPLQIMEPEDLLSRSTKKEPAVFIQKYGRIGTGGFHSEVWTDRNRQSSYSEFLKDRNRRFSYSEV